MCPELTAGDGGTGRHLATLQNSCQPARSPHVRPAGHWTLGQWTVPCQPTEPRVRQGSNCRRRGVKSSPLVEYDPTAGHYAAQFRVAH